MKLLVTGGAGFIGSNFILYWMNKHNKDKIVNLDKLTYAGNLENLVEVENNPNYQFIKGDICNVEDVERAMQGIDLIVHFAAESHVDRSLSGPESFADTNTKGTLVLLNEAVKNKTRFHHISTDEVYGALSLEDSNKFDENTAYDPQNPYSVSKAAADMYVKIYFKTHNLPITISNCSNNYGPYQFPEKLIPLAITNILEGKKVPIYGDGEYVRDWLYVVDHCKAIEKIIEKGVIGETYCVGGMTEDTSNLKIIKKLLKILDKGEEFIEFVKDRPGHDRRYAINWNKIKNLGWKPEHDFGKWLEKTVKWYQVNESWWKRVKTGEYHKK